MVLSLLVSLIGRLVARSGRKRGNRQTDRQNDKPSTVTLAAHARRGLITSAIQRINGASLKEHWASQRNQAYKQQHQRLQHNTGLKYKMTFFLSSVQS